jgi:hypothetical protein
MQTYSSSSADRAPDSLGCDASPLGTFTQPPGTLIIDFEGTIHAGLGFEPPPGRKETLIVDQNGLVHSGLKNDPLSSLVSMPARSSPAHSVASGASGEGGEEEEEEVEKDPYCSECSFPCADDVEDSEEDQWVEPGDDRGYEAEDEMEEMSERRPKRRRV